MKSPQFWTKNEPKAVSSTAIEVYLPTVEITKLLQISDNELTRLARSSVLVREPDPYNSRAYIFPCFENVRRCNLHCRARKESAHTAWLQEKARSQKVQRRRAQLELAVREGQLVDKEQLLAELTPRFIAVRKVLERLLEAGVSEAIVAEVLAIFGREPGLNGQERM
jgi:hypothetical protein